MGVGPLTVRSFATPTREQPIAVTYFLGNKPLEATLYKTQADYCARWGQITRNGEFPSAAVSALGSAIELYFDRRRTGESHEEATEALQAPPPSETSAAETSRLVSLLGRSSISPSQVSEEEDFVPVSLPSSPVARSPKKRKIPRPTPPASNDTDEDFVPVSLPSPSPRKAKAVKPSKARKLATWKRVRPGVYSFAAEAGLFEATRTNPRAWTLSVDGQPIENPADPRGAWTSYKEAKAAAKRHRDDEPQPSSSPTPTRPPLSRARAYPVHVDAVTGLDAPSPAPGTVPTSRFAARVRLPGEGAYAVPIDREELMPPDGSRRIDLPSQTLRTRARSLAKQHQAVKRKPRTRIPGIRRTFTTPRAAARLFYDQNREFFDAAAHGDPGDLVRDWLDRFETKVHRTSRSRGGKGAYHRKTQQTAWGRKLVDTLYRAPQTGLEDVLTWLFGKTRTRRWSDVDWDTIRSLGDALSPAVDAFVQQHPEEASAMGGITWYPPASGERSNIELLGSGELSPEQTEQLSERENVEQLLEYLAELEAAFFDAKRCLSRDSKIAVRRRISQLRKLAETPDAIPNATLCGAGLTVEGDTSGASAVCGWHAIREEVRKIKQACEQPYDPLWPKTRSQELADCAVHCTGREQDRAGALLETLPTVLAPEFDMRTLPATGDPDDPDDEIPF